MDNIELIYLFSNCIIETDPNSDKLSFDAFAGKENTIEKLLDKYDLKDITKAQFAEMAEQYRPYIQTKNKLRETRIKSFISTSCENIAKLPLESKIEILNTIFDYNLTNGELKNLCLKHKDKMLALLYNIKFPKEFLEEEERKADRFIALVANNKKITDNMRNWKNLDIEDKKATIMETAKIINYAYHTSLDIGFYTPEEFRKENNLDENAHVPGAYHKGGKIVFNTERLENSDNYMGVSVVFHEFTHKRQHRENFNDKAVNRLFECYMHSAEDFEEKNINKNSVEFGDIYSLMPKEVHAYTMQKYVEDRIADITGIEKSKVNKAKDVEQVHNKAFAMADITNARYNGQQK